MGTVISFSEEEIVAIDRRGSALLDALEPIQREPQDIEFSPDLFPSIRLKREDISSVRGGTMNPLTLETESLEFIAPSGAAGFGIDHCRELDRLVEAIQANPTVRPRISGDFLREKIVDWLEHMRMHDGDELLSDFVGRACNEAFRTYEVWIPLANLAVERDIAIGPVHLRVISSSVLDEWHETLPRRECEEDLEHLEVRFRKKREKLQGMAACCISIRAERTFAVKKCLEKAEHVAALLRAFHPANTTPRAAFYCRPLGSEGARIFTAEVKKNGAYEGETSSMRAPWPNRCDLGGERLEEIEDRLGRAAVLLDPARRSRFQKDVFDALMLYSKSTIADEVHDKLIYLLLALESILLKSEAEPAPERVGERLAAFLRQDAEERKATASLARECYDLRAAFIHHGRVVRDLDRLAEFMWGVWVFFLWLLSSHENFVSKEDFVDGLDGLLAKEKENA